MTVTKKYPAEIYAEQVRSGEILVCEYVRLAVERYYADLDRALDKGRYFDKKAALRAIRFIEKLEHFGNPVLRWMLSSTVVKTDPAGNIKSDKEKSTQKIDGIVAAIMALGEWMTA